MQNYPPQNQIIHTTNSNCKLHSLPFVQSDLTLPQMECEYRRLADVIRQEAKNHPAPRFLVGIAGVPGSGKTTTAEAIVQELNKDASCRAALLSMDAVRHGHST
jgi:putative protein kinase ArgK-like GTPase of G3E family